MASSAIEIAANGNAIEPEHFLRSELISFSSDVLAQKYSLEEAGLGPKSSKNGLNLTRRQ